MNEKHCPIPTLTGAPHVTCDSHYIVTDNVFHNVDDGASTGGMNHLISMILNIQLLIIGYVYVRSVSRSSLCAHGGATIVMTIINTSEHSR